MRAVAPDRRRGLCRCFCSAEHFQLGQYQQLFVRQFAADVDITGGHDHRARGQRVPVHRPARGNVFARQHFVDALRRGVGGGDDDGAPPFPPPPANGPDEALQVAVERLGRPRLDRGLGHVLHARHSLRQTRQKQRRALPHLADDSVPVGQQRGLLRQHSPSLQQVGMGFGKLGVQQLSCSRVRAGSSTMTVASAPAYSTSVSSLGEEKWLVLIQTRHPAAARQVVQVRPGPLRQALRRPRPRPPA